MLLAPIIILDKPQLGDNIGMAARAMRNCGLSDLRLVAPRDGWPNPKAMDAASGASDIIEQTQCFDVLSDALHDVEFMLATTGRIRGSTLPVYQPSSAINLMGEKAQKGQIAVLFGGERSGLDNDAVSHAHGILNFPLAPDFKSLNLSHAVLLVAWEWRRFTMEERMGDDNPPNLKLEEETPASLGDLDHLHQRIMQQAGQGGFFKNAEMTPIVARNLRMLLTKASLTQQEVSTLHGLLRAIYSANPQENSGNPE